MQLHCQYLSACCKNFLSDGNSELHLASKNGKLQRVKSLIKKGGDVRKKGMNGKTAVHMAAEEGHIHIVKYLVNRNPINLEDRDSRNQTPLHLAVIGEHFDVIKYLIAVGADLKAVDSNNNTPLIMICKRGHSDTKDFPIKNNCFLCNCFKNNTHCNFRIANHLIACGADIEAKNDDQYFMALYSRFSRVSQKIVLRQKLL